MTTIGLCQWRILVLASSLLSLMIKTSYSNAESIIAVDIGTMKGSRDASNMALASVKIDNDDLFTMPTFNFTGIRDGEDAAVYTKIEATSRKMDSGANEIVWRGFIDEANGHGFATLIRDDNGNVFGTFTTKLAAYDLLNIPGQNPQVRIILWENERPGTGIVEDDSILTESSSSETNQEIVVDGSFEPDHSGKVVTAIGEEVVKLENVNRKLIRLDEKRKLQGNTLVDILVVVTNRARCEWVGLSRGCEYTEANTKPMDDEIAVLQTVTNDAMSKVGAGVTVRIVKTIYLNAEYDANPDETALLDIRNRFQNYRDDAGADLVSMITGNISAGMPGGIAYLNKPESVNSIDSLSVFVFTHELGHNFGCYHNRENSTTQHEFAHALQEPEQAFRTVMAYRCDNSDKVCPRIPYYSAKGYTYKDIPFGYDDADNARMIRLTRSTVASWKASKSPPYTPPTSSPLPPPSSPPSCFSSINTVDVKDVGEILIGKLKIGDFVKTTNKKFTQVYGFGHYDHDMQQAFIQIILDDDTSKNSDIPFEVTSDHLVFVERNNKFYSIPASEIIIGDHFDGRKVEGINIVSRRGVYAPLTDSGDLFVNGEILVSNYVNILHSNSLLDQHLLGHALVFPQRLICRYNINICKKEAYINGYGILVYVIVKIGSFINMFGWFGNMVVTMLSIPLVGLVYILESITIFRLIIVAGTLAVVGRYTLMKNSKI